MYSFSAQCRAGTLTALNTGAVRTRMRHCAAPFFPSDGNDKAARRALSSARPSGPRASVALASVGQGFEASFISGLFNFGFGFGLRGDVSAAAFAEPAADVCPYCVPAVCWVTDFAACCLDALSGSALG